MSIMLLLLRKMTKNKSKLKKEEFLLNYSSGGLNTNSGSEDSTAVGRNRKLADDISFTQRKQRKREQAVCQGHKLSNPTSRYILPPGTPPEFHNLSKQCQQLGSKHSNTFLCHLNFITNFLRNHHIHFQSDCSSLHSHQQNPFSTSSPA